MAKTWLVIADYHKSRPRWWGGPMHSVPCSFLVKVGKRARGRLDICPKKSTTAVFEAKIYARSAQFVTFDNLKEL